MKVDRLIKRLVDRGLVSKSTYKSGDTFYCGYDPTAQSLHIGHLLTLMPLMHLSREGADIGNATACIGDPSGKSLESMKMQNSEIEHNTISLKKQIAKLFDSPIRIVENLDWYRDLSILEFMNQVGRHTRVSVMIGRESVKQRLESKDGISFNEFSYQTFQAFDFFKLFELYGCTTQVGGDDQWGNIASGIDLAGKKTGKRVFGSLTVPLLQTANGDKIGKSEGNAIWLDAQMTNPFDLYQYFINTPDTQVEKYLKLFTFIPLETVSELMHAHQQSPELRLAQKELASSVTKLVHSESELRRVQLTSAILFEGLETDSIKDFADFTADNAADTIKDVFSCSSRLLESDSLDEACFATGLFGSKSELKRMIQSGGVTLNGAQVNDASTKLQSGFQRLNIGKKEKFLVLNKVGE